MPDPFNYEVDEGTTGINVLYEYLTEEIVQKAHTAGNYVGVWYATATKEESEEMWDEVFSVAGKGVDFFFSDKPQEAMKARDKL